MGGFFFFGLEPFFFCVKKMLGRAIRMPGSRFFF